MEFILALIIILALLVGLWSWITASVFRTIFLVAIGLALLVKWLAGPSHDDLFNKLLDELQQMSQIVGCTEYLAMANTVFTVRFYTLGGYIKYLKMHGRYDNQTLTTLGNCAYKAEEKSKANSSGWGIHKSVDRIKAYKISKSNLVTSSYESGGNIKK